MSNITLSNEPAVFLYHYMSSNVAWSSGINNNSRFQHTFSGNLNLSRLENPLEYIFETLPKKLQFTKQQNDAVAKVREFIKSQNMTITNDLYPSEGSPSDIMGTFVLRLLKHIYDNKIVPAIEKVNGVFAKIMEPIQSSIVIDPNNNNKGSVKIPPNFSFENFLRQDCDSWWENQIPRHLSLPKNYLGDVIMWYTSYLLHNFTSNPSKHKTTAAIIKGLERMQYDLKVSFFDFTSYCSQKLSSKKPIDEDKGTYYSYVFSKSIVNTKMQNATRTLQKEMEVFERLINRFRVQKMVKDDYFIL